MNRLKVENAILWVYVILSAVVIGAGFYEMLVTVPTWAHSPPESVWFWEAQRAVDPRYVPDSGVRFWIFLTPFHALFSIAMFAVGWIVPGPHRKWVLISSALFFLLHLSAFIWFVPILRELATSKAAGLSPDVVAAKVRLWVTMSWWRAPLGTLAFIAGLLALTTARLVQAEAGRGTHKT